MSEPIKMWFFFCSLTAHRSSLIFIKLPLHSGNQASFKSDEHMSNMKVPWAQLWQYFIVQHNILVIQPVDVSYQERSKLRTAARALIKQKALTSPCFSPYSPIGQVPAS